MGDINGDGKPDIVVSIYSLNLVGVYLNSGNGAFAGRIDYPTGLTPGPPILSDINGDGKLDVVTPNGGNNTLSVLLNLGNGAFGPKTDLTTNAGTITAGAGDFDADGRIDVAVANYDLNVVTLYRNTAVRSAVSGTLTLNGIFASAPSQTVKFTFRSSGFPDFAPSAQVPATGAFSILLPKRKGTLHITAPRYLATNVTLDATTNVANLNAVLVPGDIDGSNVIDIGDLIALLNAYGASTGDGTYETQPLADLNLDGTIDLTDLILLLNSYGSTGGNRPGGKPGR